MQDRLRGLGRLGELESSARLGVHTAAPLSLQLGGCSMEASALVKGISRGLGRGIFEIAGSGLS